MSLDDLTEFRTATDLGAHRISPKDLRRLCPGAVELASPDTSPCPPFEDLAGIWARPERGNEL